MKRFIVICALLLTARVASATTYYVSTSGNDGQSCSAAQSTSTPKRTLNNAVTCLSSGDTLLVRAGTYAEGLSNPPIASGVSSSAPTRIAAYPSETVWLIPTGGDYVVYISNNLQYVEFDGINMDGANIAQTTVISFDERSGGTNNHIRVQNAEIKNKGGPGGGSAAIVAGTTDHEFINLSVHGTAGPYGFYISGSRNLIDRCDIYNTSSLGIHIYKYGGNPTANIVRNTRIHDLTTSYFFGQPDTRMSGILVSGTGHQIYNNLIDHINFPYQSGNDGISVYTGSGHKIWNNTIANNTTECIVLTSGTGISAVEVRNNICYGNTGPTFEDGGSGTTQTNNMFAGTNPVFVNAGTGDYHLQNTSPAIDAGATISAFNTDKDLVSRPKGAAWDIGAYEYCTSGCGAVAPPAPKNLRITGASANAQVNALCALLNNGYLKLYTGTQPATADTAVTTQTLAASLRFNATACASPSSGVAVMNAITPDDAADATGDLAWFRALKSDGTTAVLDGSVSTSGADLNVNQTFIAAGVPVTVSSFSISVPLQATTAGGLHALRLTNLAANAAADTLTALLNNGYLDIYDGSQPVTADTAIGSQVRLASLRWNATAFGAAVAGVATANSITSDTDADATGTAAWFRAWKSDHTTTVFDGSVGTVTSDLILSSTSITIHGTVSVSTFTVTASKG